MTRTHTPTTRETISYRQIGSLMAEAQLAGDHEQVALCETVLAQERTYTGSTPADDAHTAAEHAALDACVVAIRSANEEDDSPDGDKRADWSDEY
jgi:hypothetical protein